MGFSTGKWEGNILTVYTTHIKTGWMRRNGVPESDRATLTEHFIVHDKYLTHVNIISDPAYLTEPLIKSQNFVLDPGWQGAWIWPCEYVEEVSNRPKGAVPTTCRERNPLCMNSPTVGASPRQRSWAELKLRFPNTRRR